MSNVIDDQLQNQAADYVALAAKSVLGFVPFVGSALAEFAGSFIPNQRMERVAKFAIELSRRLSEAEQHLLKNSLQNPDFGDLMEESMRLAASSLSDERRAYLASLVAKSMDVESISAADSRHVLRILGQLNDVEVILLRSYLVATLGGDEEFRKKHAAVLEPVAAFIGSDRPTLDKAAMRDGYRFHLSQLGLLHEQLQVDSKTKQPVLDSWGKWKTRGYDLTPMGRLVLRMIGLTEDGFDPAPEQPESHLTP